MISTKTITDCWKISLYEKQTGKKVDIDFVLCRHVPAENTMNDRKMSYWNMLIVHRTLMMNVYSTDLIIDYVAKKMAIVYHDNLSDYWLVEQEVMVNEPDVMILNNHLYDDDDNDWMNYCVMKQVENLMMYVLNDSYNYYSMDFSNRKHYHAKNVD